MPCPVYTADRQVWRDGHLGEGTRLIPEETAIALTYNGGTYAVMMGTPQNLRDFAIGFSLSEGIVQSADEVESLEYRGTRRRHRVAHVAGAIASRARQRTQAPHRGTYRVRHLRDRFDRRSRTTRRSRDERRALFAGRDHGGDGEHGAVAGAQCRDPRGARRRVVDAIARHRRVARGCRPPQRARQACRRAGAIKRLGRRRHGAADQSRSRSRWCRRLLRSARR